MVLPNVLIVLNELYQLCIIPLPFPEGEYFSEEQMRIREPLLYEQYIGQYLTDEEVRTRAVTALYHNLQFT